MSALALSLVVFGLIFVVTVMVERRKFGQLVETAPAGRPQRWLRGPWPLVAGAIGLAAVNLATLLLAGRPWGVTSAFALWGAKAAAAVGVPVDTWPYWSSPGQLAALGGSVFGDVTSVMDFGIILGALLAALLAGRFAPVWQIPARSLAAAVIGGVLLGYGAFQRHRLGQPARLAVAAVGVRRQRARHVSSAHLRAERGADVTAEVLTWVGMTQLAQHV